MTHITSSLPVSTRNLLCIVFILQPFFVNCIWRFLSSSLCCVIFVFIYFHLCFFSWFFLLFVLVWQAKHCVQGNSWLHEHRLHQHVYRWVYSQDCRIWSAGKEHPHLTTATPQHTCSCIKRDPVMWNGTWQQNVLH